MESPITAFVFERCGRSYAVIWHKTGECKLEIPVSDAKYERDLGKELLPIEKKDGSIIVNVDDAAYLSLDISLEELKEKLRKSTVI